jgi:RNA polymerase sigma-70 factor (sigma-E family)
MRSQDEDEFARFVHAHGAMLFRTAYLLVGNHQQAEDLVQTTLVKVYLRWTRISDMAQPAAYARRILVNQTSSWWRRRSSHEVPVMTLEEPAWLCEVDDLAEHERVWQAVLSLPPRQRAVMVLRYFEDLSETQTAEVLGMAVGTVKSHAHAACRRLATVLGDDAVEAAEEAQR